jgi:hypothetical protein
MATETVTEEEDIDDEMDTSERNEEKTPTSFIGKVVATIATKLAAPPRPLEEEAEVAMVDEFNEAAMLNNLTVCCHLNNHITQENDTIWQNHVRRATQSEVATLLLPLESIELPANFQGIRVTVAPLPSTPSGPTSKEMISFIVKVRGSITPKTLADQAWCQSVNTVLGDLKGEEDLKALAVAKPEIIQWLYNFYTGFINSQ